MIVCRWQDWGGTGLEHLVLDESGGAVLAESVVLGPAPAQPFAARYRIECDSAWHVRRFELILTGNAGSLQLCGDARGTWVAGDGRERLDLSGALDIDISVTPFTNTLPIRRLRLEPGDAREIRTVYIRVPELSVTIARQRYTCLELGRYLYQSVDGSFEREITTDTHGLVLSYPGLFKRTL